MNERDRLTPQDLGARASLLVDKHAAYIKKVAEVIRSYSWHIHMCQQAQFSTLSLAVIVFYVSRRMLHEKLLLPLLQTDKKLPTLNSKLPIFCSGLHKLTSFLQTTDNFEYYATEHFRMSGVYWGVTTLHLLGKLDMLDGDSIVEWVGQRHNTIPAA